MTRTNASGKQLKNVVLPDWYLRSRLKMRQILLLVALDEHRNMHKAASSVAMTQPAATRLIGDLERLLGVVLFDRSARGVQPNAYGESLIRHSRMMLATLDHARDEINEISSGTTGKTSLGAMLVAAPTLVPRGLVRFKQRQPNHTVLVREGNTASLITALWRGEIDLIVGRASKDVMTEGVRFEALYDEPMCVVTRVEHPLSRKRALRFEALAEEQWILPTPDAIYRQRIDEAFREAGSHPPRQVVESLSIVTNLLMVKESDMLAIMPSRVAHHYAKLGEIRILSVTPPALSGPVGVITLIGRPLTPGAMDVIQALRETAVLTKPI
jgi:DNA-binding transcriptional LysR family regulator